MEKIVELHWHFYHRLMKNKEAISTLQKENIEILDGFIKNIDLVRKFYQTYYRHHSDRIVLCGMNPGRLGAGQTGIPFMDFHAISQLFPDVQQHVRERSAQLIWSVIKEFGINNFYDHVYLTNISWLRFTKDEKNLNYYELPSTIQNIFTNTFIEEMKIVQPKVIIPLGVEVERSLRKMAKSNRLTYPVENRLPHPAVLVKKEDRPKLIQQYKDRIRRFF